MTEYRLAPGHITQAAINADSAYIVANFADATNGYPWFVAADGIVRPYSNRRRTADGKLHGVGYTNFTWRFGILDADMWAVLDTAIFSTNQTALVTAKTWNTVTGAWEIYNAYLDKPEIDFNALRPYQQRWMLTPEYRFTRCMVAAAS